MKIVKLKIKGMTCPSCSASVERLVNKLDGVKEQNVSHENDLGVFTIDESVLSESELIAKINEGHYKVEMSEKIIPAEKTIPPCPVCNNSGRLVPNTVFKSILKAESKQKVNLEAENYICMDADCLVAYYTGKNTITKDELKRELWYKKGTKTVLACYCNNIDAKQLKDAISQYNLTSWEEITSHYRKKVIEKYETLNPKGYCCRNNFDKLVKEVKETLKINNEVV